MLRQGSVLKLTAGIANSLRKMIEYIFIQELLLILTIFLMYTSINYNKSIDQKTQLKQYSFNLYCMMKAHKKYKIQKKRLYNKHNKIKRNHKKMHKDKQVQEDEDEIITIIKSIASEILTDDDFPFDQNHQDKLNILKFSCVRSEKENKEISGRKYKLYTERGEGDREDCESQWIDYHDMRDVQVQKNNIIKKTQNKTNQKLSSPVKTNPKTPKQQQTLKSTKKPAITSPSQPNKPAQTSQSQHSLTSSKQTKTKLKLEQLNDYGFMKPKSKVTKQMIITDMYRKEQDQQQEIAKVKKSYKTLQQLYKEKEPLYEKYLKDKEKRSQAIYQSRVEEEKKIQLFNPKPQINRNIPVQGSFNERQRANLKKSQQTKSKIMSQILQQIPFKPQTNKSQKFTKIQSKVKANWAQKNQQKNNHIQTVISPKSSVISNNKRSMPKLVSRYQTDEGSSNMGLSLRLQGTSELSNILEIQDCFQE